jgi:hypothetical protein
MGSARRDRKARYRKPLCSAHEGISSEIAAFKVPSVCAQSDNAPDQ